MRAFAVKPKIRRLRPVKYKAAFFIKACIILLLTVDRYHAVDRIVERDQGFGPGDAVDHLYLVVKQIHQMLVVACIEFYEHSVGAGGEVAFHDLWDFLEFRHNVTIHCSAFEVDADICACSVAEHLGVDIVTRAGDHLEVDKTLDALMDSRALHAALHGHVFRGYTRVAHDDLKDLAIEIVDFFHLCFR